MRLKLQQTLIMMLILTLLVSCGGGDEEVPSLLTPPDYDAPTILMVTPPVSGTYIYNQNISASITFSEIVNVTGTPNLEITIDGTLVNLPYASGNGTSTLSFNRNIDLERLDSDGIDINSLNLNGGTIRDGGGNNAILTFTPTNESTVLVNSIRPTLTSVIINSGETYTTNTAATINTVASGADEILVSTSGDCSSGSFVAYNAALPYTLSANLVNSLYVQVQTFLGNKSNCLSASITHDNLAPNTATIVHVGNATATQTDSASWLGVIDNGPAGILRYEYAVSTTNDVLGIISGASWVDIGTTLSHQITSGVVIIPLTNYYTLIKAIDNAGNETITASSPWQFVLPAVTSITPPSNNTYGVNDILEFSASMNKPVTVSGTPRIGLDIGGNTRYADYVSGASTATNLVFRYTIQAGDNDLDGIQHFSPIDLNSGTIQDALSNNATLTFTPADTSSVFVDDSVVPTKLVITTQPSDTPVNSDINPAITVELRDASDNLATSATDNVTIAFGTDPSSGSATLGGTLTVAAIGGIATFSDINIDTAFAGYDLVVTSGVLTSDTSTSFEITPTPQITSVDIPSANTYDVAEDLDFIVNYDRNVTVTGMPRIQLDIGENTVYANYDSGSSTPNALTFRYTVQSGDNDLDGVEHFSPIDLNSGTILDQSNGNPASLTFTPQDTSAILVSTIIVATKLVFVDQPTNATAGVTISPNITVELRDASDNLATTATDNVTLSFGADPSSGTATLGGTVTVAAVAGVATFNDINIDKAFTSYTLSATASGLTDGTSSTFDITPATKTQLAFTVEPTNGDISTVLPTFTVEIQDAFGNKTNDTDNITIAFNTDPTSGSATLSGTTSINATLGSVDFTDIDIDQYGVGYDFIASAAGLTSAISATFDINAPPVKLGFQVQPSNSIANVTINPSIIVEVQDANSNLVSSTTGSVTIAFQNDPSGSSAALSGTLTKSLVNGIATFDDISIDLAFADYTFIATSSGLTSKTSNPFDITPSAPTSLTLINPGSSPDSESAPTIQVGGVVSGDTVTLYLDSSCSVLNSSFTATGTTVNMIAAPLTNGVHNFYATRTNINSATSACSSASLTYEVVGALDQLDPLDAFGNWSNVGGDDGNWTINTGGTPSVEIGPTAGFGGSGGYAYIEASNPTGANDEFRLESNTLDGSTFDLAFNFKWNKRGDNMGDLYLEASNNGGTNWTQVWSHLGADVGLNQTDIWRNQFVDLCNLGYNTSNVKLRFRGVMPGSGNIYESDIAVDELHVTSGGCSPAPPASLDISSPGLGTSISLANQAAFTVGGTCSDNGQNITLAGDVSGSTTCSGNSWSIVLNLSAYPDGIVNIIATHTSSSGGANGVANRAFEKALQYDDFTAGLGNWSNVGYDDRDWSRTNTTTPSSNVGPDNAAGGSGYFLYTEASSPVGANDEFILESNSLDAGAYNLEIDFHWNKRGNSMGDLYLEVSTNGGSSWDTAIWSHLGVDIATGDPHVWNNEKIDLCNLGYVSGNIMFRFRAVMPATGTVWNSDIGIDNIKITNTGCP